MNRVLSPADRHAARFLGLVVLLLPATYARAACNLIPGTAKTFNATLGTTNRPFAAPGESVGVALRTCDASAGFSLTAGDQVVTVLFTPPHGAPRHAVVLRSDCTAFAGQQASCEAELGPGGTAACVQVDPVGDPLSLAVSNAQHLSFRFPDTSDLLPAAVQGPGRTLAGPATIAVTRRGDPLPCALATVPCLAQAGLIACIDDFLVDNGACGTMPTTPFDITFGHFTALPPPNDYQAACVGSPPCSATPTASEVRFALDAAGNLLAPVDWRGILVLQGAVPVPRLLRGTLAPPMPIRVPGRSFSASYSPEGGVLPPIFEPEADPTVPENVLTLFGSADAPYTILRLARHNGRCAGGPNDGQACASFEDCPGLGAQCLPACAGGINDGAFCSDDSQCPGGVCGSLFDLTGLGLAGVGPVVLARLGPGVCQLAPHPLCTTDAACSGPLNPCVRYAFEAQIPVPVEGLVQTSNLSTFVVSESLAGRDLNGDGDTDDSVVTLTDRNTGQMQPIGAEPACGIGDCPEGRAVARIVQPPFSFPAVADERNVVAFLEPEAATNNPTTHLACDLDGDGDVLDTFLRVFRLDPTASAGTCPTRATEVTAGMELAVDATPRIDGQSLAASNGLVFFRAQRSCPSTCINPRVGTAGDCTVLALGGGRVNVTGSAGGVDDNVCVGPKGMLSITGSQFVTGTIRLASGATLRKSGPGTIGPVLRNEDLAAEIGDATAAAAEAAALPCTQKMVALTTSQVITGAGGLNVVCVRDVTLNGHEVVTLSGTAADTFVFSVSGQFVLTSGSKIVAAGVPASAILYNVIGAGPPVALSGGPGGGSCCGASVDGTILAVQRDIALAPGLVNGEVIGGQDISITDGASVRCRACPATTTASVLKVVNASTGAVTALCPAGAVSVADGNAAFLRPEAAGDGPGCPPGPDLNGDGDTKDQVVHLSLAAGPAENLQCAARSVSLSTDWLAALLSSAGAGPGVVAVHRVSDGAGACSAPTWRTPTDQQGRAQVGDVVAASGPIVAFITPEAAQGTDLNGDGDTADRVLQLYDAATDQLINPGLAAQEFVLGSPTVTTCGRHQLVAFRTHEADQCGVPVDAAHCQGGSLPAGCTLAQCDLNRDGDCCDDVLNIYDFNYDTNTGSLIRTRQAVTPCRLAACDPRLPYRVLGGKVKFLTLEADQGRCQPPGGGCQLPGGGCDLDCNGDTTGLVLQSFDLCAGIVKVFGPVDTSAGAAVDPLAEEPGSEVYVSAAGRCVANGVELLVPGSCRTGADCPPGATCAPAAFPVVAANVVPTTTTTTTSTTTTTCVSLSGMIAGTFTGGHNGSFTMDLTIMGTTLSGSAVITVNGSGPISTSVSGTNTCDGNITVGSIVFATFTGTISGSCASGTWAAIDSTSGTWSGCETSIP